MGQQIDTRIVEMRFEHDKFEKNVSQTLSSLDKLKEKLQLKNAGKGFDDLQKDVNKFSFEHLVKSIDDLNDVVRHRTGIMGGVFDELGRRIVGIFDSTFGKVQHMINQVTLEPITTGLQEYELKVNSVQVIAANTGVLMRDAMAEFAGVTGDASHAADDLASTLDKGSKKATASISASTDAMQAAYDVMMGKYGAGQDRKDALGERYKEIQDIVNDLIAQTGSVDAALKLLAEDGYTVSDSMSAMGDSVADSLHDLDEEVEYTMKDIERVLDDLNTYADKTIYNYAQMTDAIGQFTVQGVDLYDAKTAVEGLANLAAFTGVDATGAARVMREAAKGLATGFIGLQDWMSFETTGGMGGKVFQEQLLATADKLWETDEAYRDYAINAAAAANGLQTKIDESTESISEWVAEQGKFRNSLKAGWINDKVLIETLHKFAGDLSDAELAARGYTEEEINDIQALGTVAFEAATKAKTFHQMWDAVTEAVQSSWTTTWEFIFGKFYDARNLWTAISDELSNTLGAMNDARNQALQFWAHSPYGRANVLTGLARIYYFLKDAISAVGDAFHYVFGEVTGVDLVKASIKFEKWTRRLEYLEGLIDILSAVATVFFNILKAGLTIIAAFAMAIGAVFGIEPDSDILDNLGAMAWYVADLTTSLVDMGGIMDGAFSLFSTVLNILKLIPMAIVGIIMSLDELSKEFLGFSFVEKITTFVKNIPMYIFAIKEFFSTLKDNEHVKKATEAIHNFFDQFKIKIDFSNSASTAQTITKIISAIATFWATMQTIKIGKKAHSFSQLIEGIPTGILETFENLKDTFDTIKNYTKMGVIKTIANAFLEMAAALVILSLVPTDKLESAAAVMVLLTACIVILLKVMGGVADVLPNASMVQGAASFSLIALGISSLVGALLILDILPFERTIQSVIVLAILVGLVIAILKTMDHAKFGENSIKAAVAIGIIALALGGLVILVSILSLIAMFNSKGLWSAVGVIAAITGIIVVVAALAAAFSKYYNGGAVFVLMLGMVPFAAAVVALGVLAMIMSTVALVNPKGLASATNTIVILAATVAIIAVVIVVLSNLMTATKVLAVIALAFALPAIVIALVILAGACVLLSYIPVGQLKTAGIVLLALMVFLYVIIDAFGHLKPNTFLTIFVLQKSIVAFLIFIGIILALVWMMSMTDFDEKKAIIMFLGIMGVLAVMLVLIGYISNFANQTSKVTTVNRYLNFGRNSTFARLLESIAFLILAINVSLLLLVVSLKKLFEAADQFSQDGNMQKKLTDMFVGLAQGFLDSWGAIVDAVNRAGVGDTLEDWAISTIDHLINILGRLALAIIEIVGMLGEIIVDSIIILLNKLAGTDLATWMDKSTSEVLDEIKGSPLTKIFSAIVSLIALILYGLGDAIFNNWEILLVGIAHLAQSLAYAIALTFALAWTLFSKTDSSEDVIKYSREYFDNLETSLVEGWDTTVQLWNRDPRWRNAMNGLWTFFMTPVYLLAQATEALHKAWVAQQNFILSFQGLTYGEYKPFDWTTDIIKSYEEMVGNGDNAFFQLGLAGMVQVADSAKEASESIAHATELIGLVKDADVSITMTPKLADNQQDLNIAMYDSLKQAAENGVRGYNDPWNIQSSASTVSISKATKDTGEAAANGFVEGYEETIENPKTKSIFDSFFEKIGESGKAKFAEYFGLDGETDLSIQSVLKLDDTPGGLGDTIKGIGGNLGSMDSTLGDMLSGVNDTSSNLADVNNIMQTEQETIQAENGKFYDDGDLLDGVSGLNDGINNLSSKMNNFNVYIDGDKLVGAIKDKMDGALAKNAVLAGRGN